MPESFALAYMSIRYARASDSFVRREVAELRRLGHTVHTFSVRRPDANEINSEEIRAERASTEDLVAAGPFRLLASFVEELARSPRRMLDAFLLAMKVGTPGLIGRLRPFAYLIEAARLAGRLRANNVQHLHNHIGEGSAAVAMIASALTGIPYSLTIHGPGEFDRPALLALDLKIRRAAFVVAISHFGRSQLYRWSAFEDWPKIKIVHCGVDETFLEAPEAPIPSEPRLVFVGRLTPEKGPTLLIQAAAELDKRGVPIELELIGDGPMRPEVEALVDRLGLRERVRLLGWQNADVVRRAMLQSRALVLPSFAEGLPVVFFEAFALRRPAIGTIIAGIPELIQTGINGWLVPAGSLDHLVEAMSEAVRLTPEELQKLGDAGAAAVAERHDIRAEVKKLEALFASSVGPEGA